MKRIQQKTALQAPPWDIFPLLQTIRKVLKCWHNTKGISLKEVITKENIDYISAMTNSLVQYNFHSFINCIYRTRHLFYTAQMLHLYLIICLYTPEDTWQLRLALHPPLSPISQS